MGGVAIGRGGSTPWQRAGNPPLAPPESYPLRTSRCKAYGD